MATIQDQIESRIRTFVQELHGLVRSAAVDAVQGALGGSAPAKRGPGRPPKSSSAPRVAAQPKSSARSVGGKRPSELLAKTVESLRDYIVKHPGKRIEEIGPALGVKTKALALPVKKLLAAKTITRKGQKRATRYYPGQPKKS